MLLMAFQWVWLVSNVLSSGPVNEGAVYSISPIGLVYIISASALALITFYLGLYHSGAKYTRHGIAAVQVIFATILCHATGGGGASYIHVFGSLAFIAFYRDPMVILSASLVLIGKFTIHWVSNEHMGGQFASGRQLLEFISWIFVEDVFLFMFCVKSRLLLRQVSLRQSELMELNAKFEQEIADRTLELRSSLMALEEQRSRVESASKMALLGEMSAGFAHEINNPLAIIKLTVDQLKDIAESEEIDRPLLKELAGELVASTSRTIKIVKSLKTFGREGKHDPFREMPIQEVVRDTLEICRGKFRSTGVELRLELDPENHYVSCRSVQVSQVILNLLQNAIDSIEGMNEKWIQVKVGRDVHGVTISVTDSGAGIPAEIRESIFKSFFTTKEVGKGTGLGLALCKGIMDDHKGALTLDHESKNTCFVMRFPEIQNEYSTLVS